MTILCRIRIRGDTLVFYNKFPNVLGVLLSSLQVLNHPVGVPFAPQANVDASVKFLHRKVVEFLRHQT